MRKFYVISLLVLMTCLGCQWQMRTSDEEVKPDVVVVERYDRVESAYLTMADFAALHQLKTDYPLQTRTLIENVLQLGPANAPDINTRLLIYFQDSTLQALIRDVERQYDNMDDVSRQLTDAFQRLGKMLPDMEVPKIYTQIGSLDQSIVVADSMLGISLDKYLGSDYSAYLHYGYSEQQRSMMTRDYIVPDCIGFYLLSLYPLPRDTDTLLLRSWHMTKIQCVVNRAMNHHVFEDEAVSRLDKYWKEHPQTSVDDLLRMSPAF